MKSMLCRKEFGFGCEYVKQGSGNFPEEMSLELRGKKSR